MIGQSASHIVLSQFDNQERGIWINQYEGRMDDLSYVYLVLGYNQHDYKGLLQQKGVDDWHLHGEIDGGNLNLLVSTEEGDVIGYIRGTIQDSSILAVLSLKSERTERQMLLSRVLNPSIAESCGDQMWLRTFSGRLMDENIRLALQKEEASSLTGLIYFAKQSMSYTLNGECLDDACLNAEVELVNTKEVSLGKLRITKTDSTPYEVILSEFRSEDLELTQDLPMICGSHFYQDQRLSYVYPYFDNKKIDNWFKSNVTRWLSSFGQNELSDTNSKGDYRLWVDFDFIGDKMLSGTMTFKNVDGSMDRESFIFPVSGKGDIDIINWIESKEEWRRTLNEIIASEKQRMLKEFPPDAQAWIGIQKFDLYSIRKEGLCLKSDFDPIYGDWKIMIPWSIVEDFFKRSVNIQKLLK